MDGSGAQDFAPIFVRCFADVGRIWAMNDGVGAVAKFDLATEGDFRLGGLLVRPSACRVSNGLGETRIEPRVMEVLIVLSRASGATVTRDQLVDACWGGRAISDDAITRVIAKVRQLANGGDAAPHFILETLPKVGYRLTGARHNTVTLGPAEVSPSTGISMQPPSEISPTAQARSDLLGAVSKRSVLSAALVVAIVLTIVLLGMRWRQTQHGADANAEAVRLTQAAIALIHERNRLSVAEAEHLLRQAVAADPNYAPAWARLGYATWFPWWWAEQHEPGSKPRLKAEALAYVRRALAIAPNLAEAQGIMGMVLTDTNEGIPWLERAVKLNADDPELWLWLAEARLGDNELRNAREALEKARALDPRWQRSNEPYLDLVFRLRGPEEAYRELDRIAGSMNDQNWSVQERADLEYGEGRLADSAALAVTSLRAHPQNPYWARNRLVFIAALLGDRTLQDRMLALDPMLRANFNALHKPGWAAERAQNSPDTWWDATLVGAQAAQLVSEDRAAMLVSLYVRRFKTPEEFVLRCPQFCNSISSAPAVILALRKAGRRVDAERVLRAAMREIAKLETAGDRLFGTAVNGARLAALNGNTKDAMRRLRDAVSHGWKGQDTGFPDPEYDPVFANLHRDPDFQSIMKLLRASQAAEAQKLAHMNL